jgi:hypothetical protein
MLVHINKLFLKALLVFFYLLCTKVSATNKCPSNSSLYSSASGWTLYAKAGTQGITRKVTNNDEINYFRKKAALLLGGFWAPKSMAAPTTATCAYHGLTEPTVKPMRYWLGKNIPLPKSMNQHNRCWQPDKEFLGQYICFIDQHIHECIYR